MRRNKPRPAVVTVPGQLGLFNVPERAPGCRRGGARRGGLIRILHRLESSMQCRSNRFKLLRRLVPERMFDPSFRKLFGLDVRRAASAPRRP